MQDTEWKRAYEERLGQETAKPLEEIQCQNIIDGMKRSEEMLLQADVPADGQWRCYLEMFADVCCGQLPKWIKTNTAYAEAYAKMLVEAVQVYRRVTMELADLWLYGVERLLSWRERQENLDLAGIPVEKLKGAAVDLEKGLNRKFKVKTGRRYNVLLRVFENTYEKMPPTGEMAEKCRILRERMAQLDAVFQTSDTGSAPKAEKDGAEEDSADARRMAAEARIRELTLEIEQQKKRVFGRKAAAKVIEEKELLLAEERKKLGKH